MMMKKMPVKKAEKAVGVMPSGMYADGGKVKMKPAGAKAEMKKMQKFADGGMVGSGCGPGYVADWNRKDMKK